MATLTTATPSPPGPDPSTPFPEPSIPSPLFAPPTLPLPLYEALPDLYCRVLHFFNSSVGLSPADRLVLGGVFQFIPVLDSVATTGLLDRLQLLDATNLKLLADLFTAGLLDARSWGGRRTSGTRSSIGTPTTPAPMDALTTNSEYNELFRQLSILSPFPPPQSSSDRASTTSQRAKRSAKLSRLCLKRQNDECPLTGESDVALETAHLVSFSVAAPRRADTAFWLMLAVCLGPELRDHLHTIIHGHKSYTTANGLTLQSVLHKYFDRGAMALEPDLLHTSVYEPAFTTHFDVVFRWRDTLQGLRLRITVLPLDPDAQIITAADGSWAHATLAQERRIDDSHKFRLYTSDPERLPLPHPFLLSLHARLWCMIQSAGLSETIDRKRKRVARPREREDDNDDDDDSSGEDNGGARKRLNKSKRRPGSSKRGSGKSNHSGPQTVPQAGPSSSTQSAHGPQDTHSPSLPGVIEVPTSPSAPPALDPAPSRAVPEAESRIPFLEQQYLAFRLGNPDSSTAPDFSDSDTNSVLSTDEEYSTDSSDESESFYGNPFSSDDDSGSEAERSDSDTGDDSSLSDVTLVEMPKTFLELQWERFVGRGPKERRLKGSGGHEKMDGEAVC